MRSSRPGPVLSARDVSRTFYAGEHKTQAVRGVNLTVARGEFLALVGKSGSGKTTLLNILGGLDQPDTGEVQVEGRDLAGASEAELVELRRTVIGFVFQSFGLLPLLSAYENVELALRLLGVGHRDRTRRTTEALELVGLGNRARHRPYELSGGEQQRVAIARALVKNPSMILADEPTGHLDSLTAQEVFGTLRTITRERHTTTITATHDRALLSMVGRVVTLQDGAILEGRSGSHDGSPHDTA